MPDPLMPDWVHDHAAATPAAPAVVFEGSTTTYAELHENAQQSADELRSAGVGAGSLMPVAAVPVPGTVVFLTSGPRVGATIAPFGPTPPQGELDADLDAYAVVTTAGSSGDPKGVILTRGNVDA